jgi:hypothetical protein
VWLYFRFSLSLQLVEEMLLERGIIVSYETIRRWAGKRRGLCQATAKQEAIANGHLASGRGDDFHRRPEPLALTSRRSGRLRS